MQAALPYAAKTKAPKPQRDQTYMQKRAVVMQPEEKRAVALLQQIQSLRKDKIARREEKKAEQREAYRKKAAKVDEAKTQKHKEERKQQLRTASIKAKHAEQASAGGRGKKRQRTE
jgi:ribosome biogenesis protein BMS1